MKILMIHPHDIYSASEPWTIRITSLALEYIKKGHEVRLIYFPLSKTHRGLVKGKKIEEFPTTPLIRNDMHILNNIKKMIGFGKWADIIHIQKCFAHASIPAVFSAYANNKPIHYDWDDWEYGIYMWKPPSKIYSNYLNILERTIPSLVDSISVSSDELWKMAALLGFDEKKMIKANVCADLHRFKPGNKKTDLKEKYGIKGEMILYLGQLHGAQYAELLVDAAKIINKKFPAATVVFAGGGADMPRLRYKSEQLLLENVRFTGYISDKEVDDYLQMADIAVACFADSRQVRCKSPLKIAEYMASGKAIVASRIGEIPWMIKDAGIMTEPDNYTDLAEGILRLLNDKGLRLELEAKARKRAEEKFDWSIVADKMLSLYKKIVF